MLCYGARDMANMKSRLKSGNALGRVRQALKHSHKRYYLAPPENPRGIPSSVMKALAREHLPNDVDAFDLRLQQLLTLHELNKGD
jgi:hypothetical protein